LFSSHLSYILVIKCDSVYSVSPSDNLNELVYSALPYARWYHLRFDTLVLGNKETNNTHFEVRDSCSSICFNQYIMDLQNGCQ